MKTLENVESVIQQYEIPASSVLHLKMPNLTTVGKMRVIDQKDVIEEMSSAEGGNTAEIKALEQKIADMTKALQADEEQSAYYARAIANMESEHNDREQIWQSCTYNNLSVASKRWKCSNGNHDEAWRKSERTSLDSLNHQINNTYQLKKALDSKIQTAKDDLPKLKSDLESLRVSSFKAGLTPQERNAYEQQQAQNQAIQTIAEKEAEAKAEAIIKSSSAKSKTLMIVGIAAAVALLGGVVIFFVTRKKKLAVAVKPMAAMAK